MGLIAHLESYLGPIAGGNSGDETTPEGVQVAFFGPDVPYGGVTTLVTAGLWRRHLELPDGGSMHQELLMHVPNSGYPGRAAGLLFQVAGELAGDGAALPYGRVIGPRGPLFPGTEVTSMVAISPRYLPEGFAVCRTEPVPVVVTWLVPITTTEAEAVRARGWGALEQAFVAQDPELSDPGRPPVRLDGTGA